MTIQDIQNELTQLGTLIDTHAASATAAVTAAQAVQSAQIAAAAASAQAASDAQAVQTQLAQLESDLTSLVNGAPVPGPLAASTI